MFDKVVSEDGCVNPWYAPGMEVQAEVTVFARFEVCELDQADEEIAQTVLNNGIDWHDIIDVLEVGDIEV